MNEDEARDLLDRAQQISDLTKHPGWPLLIDAVNETRAAKQHTIAFGGVKSWEDYIREVAWFQGTEFVFKTPERVRNAANEARGQAG